MTDIRQAAEMALDALELECTDINGNKVDLVNPAIEALRQALADQKLADAFAEDFPNTWGKKKYTAPPSKPEQNCYGDGNVYRGMCSKDSEVRTIHVGLTAPPEQGCCECGVTVSEGYALYCVKCSEPLREWVVLTDAEIAEAVGNPLDEVYLADFRKVIAKLKEKNT